MNKKQLSRSEFQNYKKLLQKKYREINQTFIIEGIHLVNEALKSNLVDVILTAEDHHHFDFQNVKKVRMSEIASLSSTKTPQNTIAICKFLKTKPIGNQILILNKINDPGNLGTLIRTAYAFGFNDIIVEGVDIYNPKVLRASQGAIFWANVFNVKKIREYLTNLKKQNYQIIGSLLDVEATDYHNLKLNKKIALVLGNEAQGIEKDLLEFLDAKVYIPIQFESLNVAAAGAILMAQYTKIKIK